MRSSFLLVFGAAFVALSGCGAGGSAEGGISLPGSPGSDRENGSDPRNGTTDRRDGSDKRSGSTTPPPIVTPAPTECDATHPCAAGYVCNSKSTKGGICLRLCTPGATDSGCGPGEYCVGENDLGACRVLCTSSETCPAVTGMRASCVPADSTHRVCSYSTVATTPADAG